jgi:hypothetical protein
MTSSEAPLAAVRGIVWAIPASLALWCALLVLIGVAHG